MKAILTKLDNGYTLTLVEDDYHPDTGEKMGEQKQRLVFERKEDAVAKITEVM